MKIKKTVVLLSLALFTAALSYDAYACAVSSDPDKNTGTCRLTSNGGHECYLSGFGLNCVPGGGGIQILE